MNESRHDNPASSAAARPIVAFALAPGDPADWQHRLVSRIRALDLCEVIVWPVGSITDTDVTPTQSGQAMTAIIDLTGRFGADRRLRAKEGIWRLCDGRSVMLGTDGHGLETVAAGAGLRLHLIADNNGKTALIGTAGAYADPGQTDFLPRLGTLAETLVLAALREIRVLGALEPRPGWTASGARPRWARRILWKIRGQKNHVLRRLKHMLLVEQWMIGIVALPIGAALRSRQLPVRWIGEHVSTHYWADPFGAPGRNSEIYCEEYDYKKSAGRIVRLRFDGYAVRGQPVTVDLGLPGHLSYPYIFDHADATYCVAESAQSRRCVLNRQRDDGRWTQVAVLLHDTEAADPTIFEHGGYFWLAYTDVSLGAFDNLCLCYASDLLGPWHAHPQNPVKIDHCSARSAGAVAMVGDRLLRTAQVCEHRYGEAIAINRILHCTPDFYREETVGTIGPERGSMNPHGLHTLSVWGDRVLVDGKRYGINWPVLNRKFASRITRMANRLRARRQLALPEKEVRDKL